MKDLCSCGTEKDRRAKQCRSCSGQKLRTNFKCTVDGCEKDAWSSGLCSMHLRRVKRHGDVDKVLWGPESEAWNLRTPITPNSYGVCWEWTGYLFNKGEIGREYGGVFLDGKRNLVHRLAWEAVNGPIPQDKEVCHSCDNPKCWRPDHLFLGSHKENMVDMSEKGRRPTKLSDDEVRQIQGIIQERGPTVYRGKDVRLRPSNSELGRMFSVTDEIIHRIESGTRTVRTEGS